MSHLTGKRVAILASDGFPVQAGAAGRHWRQAASA